MRSQITGVSRVAAWMLLTLLLSIALATAAAPAYARADVRQVGYLISGPPASWANRLEALRMGLRDLGYVEGKNIAIEVRSVESADLLPQAAAELVRLDVDVIFATSSTEVEAARRATKTIPIVFATHADPVGIGHVASLARPGGNITGLSMSLPEIATKELEIMKQALPHVARIGVVLTSTAPSHAAAMEALNTAAQALGLQVFPVLVRGPEDLEAAFALMVRERVDGFLAVASPLTRSQRVLLAELSLKYRLAGIFGTKENVEAGGLMSYAPDLVDLTRRAAAYIDKILKRVKPAELPVEQASRYEFIINVRTAEALGITIPRSVLVQADRIIQ